jgi:hypothetical protein
LTPVGSCRTKTKLSMGQDIRAEEVESRYPPRPTGPFHGRRRGTHRGTLAKKTSYSSPNVLRNQQPKQLNDQKTR